MIAAIDTFGNIYYALMQANSTEDTMRLFFTKLVDYLDAEKANWRKDTVLCLDGASWHQASATHELLRRLNIPTMISGPYQYDSAAYELFLPH